MTRISSRKTFFLKKLLPALLVGWLVISVVTTMFNGTPEENTFYVFVLSIVAFVVGYLAYRVMRPLADEVLDHNDYLLVSRGSEQDRVALSNIMNVGTSATVANIPLITLRLVKPSKFGPEIVFLPVAKLALNLGGKNGVAEQLIERAHEARSKGEV